MPEISKALYISKKKKKSLQGNKKLNLTLEVCLLKMQGLIFSSYNSMVTRIVALRSKKKKEHTHTKNGCCILCSYCKYFMNGYLRAKYQDKNSL